MLNTAFKYKKKIKFFLHFLAKKLEMGACSHGPVSVCKLKAFTETKREFVAQSLGWELPGFVAHVPVAVAVFFPVFPHWKQCWPCPGVCLQDRSLRALPHVPFLAHSTQHLLPPSKLGLMGEVHSSIIVLGVWDAEGSPPLHSYLTGKKSRDAQSKKKKKNQPKHNKPLKTSSLMSNLKSQDRTVNNGPGDLDLQIFTFPWLG